MRCLSLYGSLANGSSFSRHSSQWRCRMPYDEYCPAIELRFRDKIKFWMVFLPTLVLFGALLAVCLVWLLIACVLLSPFLLPIMVGKLVGRWVKRRQSRLTVRYNFICEEETCSGFWVVVPHSRCTLCGALTNIYGQDRGATRLQESQRLRRRYVR